MSTSFHPDLITVDWTWREGETLYRLNWWTRVKLTWWLIRRWPKAGPTQKQEIRGLLKELARYRD